MLLDLTRIRQPETDLQRQYAASAFEGRDHAFRIIGPVELRATVFKDRDRYRLVGRVRTEIELVCSRCLEPYRVPVDASFDLRYLPLAETSAEGEREVEDDDLAAAYYRDDQIDLGQVVEEQIYLGIPMKPLCREGCLGLCPQCGTNLNVETCSCDTQWTDPRMAGLKAILSERKNNDA